MSTEVWGLMPKSQIDTETVEEAITRIVGVHEADPTSHLGENESIDAHRKSEVIDHLAFSIPVDKQVIRDLVYNFNFSSLDALNKIGSITLNSTDGVIFDVANPSPLESTLYFNSQYFNTLLKDDSDINFETSVFLDYTTESFYASWGLAFVESGSGDNGFSFYATNGHLYAYVKRNTTIVSSEIVGISATISHYYRAFYNKTDEKVYFYIDDSLIKTLTVPVGGSWSEGTPNIGSIIMTGTGEVLMYMLYFNCWRKILTI